MFVLNRLKVFAFITIHVLIFAGGVWWVTSKLFLVLVFYWKNTWFINILWIIGSEIQIKRLGQNSSPFYLEIYLVLQFWQTVCIYKYSFFISCIWINFTCFQNFRYVSAKDLQQYTIVLSKAKTFGIHYDIYKVVNAAGLDEDHTWEFNWLKD